MRTHIKPAALGRLLAPASLGCLIAASLCAPSAADVASSSTGGGIAVGGGAAVYEHVCQGCHMANGKGATGSGAIFPAFAGNAKLANSGYPIYVVLNGLGGMPWFNGVLSDAQIAGVVTYIRTSFGNHYTDAVTSADVAAQRGPAPTPEQ